MDDNRAVESFGSWILNLTDLKSEPAGTESCIIPYPASEATSLKLELDVVNELIFEVSDSADEISIKMEMGIRIIFLQTEGFRSEGILSQRTPPF